MNKKVRQTQALAEAREHGKETASLFRAGAFSALNRWRTAIKRAVAENVQGRHEWSDFEDSLDLSVTQYMGGELDAEVLPGRLSIRSHFVLVPEDDPGTQIQKVIAHTEAVRARLIELGRFEHRQHRQHG